MCRELALLTRLGPVCDLLRFRVGRAGFDSDLTISSSLRDSCTSPCTATVSWPKSLICMICSVSVETQTYFQSLSVAAVSPSFWASDNASIPSVCSASMVSFNLKMLPTHNSRTSARGPKHSSIKCQFGPLSRLKITSRKTSSTHSPMLSKGNSDQPAKSGSTHSVRACLKSTRRACRLI